MKAVVRKTRCSWNEPGHAHYLTYSCFRRLPLLTRDRVRHWVIEALEHTRAHLDVALWAYVIMPEHVHLLFFPRQETYSVSRILTAIKWPVARAALGYLRDRNSPWIERLTDRQPNGRMDVRFWQRGGGYDRNITKESTLHEVIQYIHGNPVRRGLVGDASEWYWSSAGWYADRREVPLALDDTLPMIRLDGARKHVRP